jgi:prepilin-type N-terminal cleavage/methylation domain-containing protein
MNRRLPASRWAFTLVEVIVSMAVVGIMFVSLYAGISHGFSTARLARENLSATQAVVERLETIRLYTWDQINSNGFIPLTLQVGSSTLTNVGLVYTVRLAFTNGPSGMNYSTNLKTVKVQASWTSGGKQHQREMTTYVSRQGLHQFLY